MSRTLILILVLIFSVVGLLALSLNNKPESATTVVPVSLAQSTLSLTAPRASSSGILTSDILIKTNGNKAMAAQLELSYNPQDISVSDITAGSFFKGATELLKKIDADNGRISYALGVAFGQKGISGQGIVATITFTKLKTTGTTQIDFLAKSLVSAEGISQSVLRSTMDTKFDLSITSSTPFAK